MKKNTAWRIAFAVPGIAFMFTFLILPIFMTLFYSMTDWNGLSSTYNYIGFENFISVFKDSRFPQILKNTAIYVIIYVPVANILAYFLAILINEMKRGANLCKVLIFVPNLLSMVVVGNIWQSMYSYTNGMINKLLTAVGLEALRMDWLGNPDLVMGSISVAVAWYAVGFYMLIYLAGLSFIPEDLYESATLDGAGWFAKQMKITLPLMRNSVITNVVLAFIGAWNMFDLPYVMTKGGPLNYSETISLRIYRYAFQETLPGKGMALAIMLTAFVMLMTLLMLRRQKGEED